MNYYRRKREETLYQYECIISGKTFKRTAKAKHPEELMSIEAYYQLNPDKDDRPLVIKKKLGVEAGVAPAVNTPEESQKE